MPKQYFCNCVAHCTQDPTRPKEDSTPEPTERPSKVAQVETDNSGAPNTPQAANGLENGQPGGGSDGEGMNLDLGGGAAGNIAPNLTNQEDAEQHRPPSPQGGDNAGAGGEVKDVPPKLEEDFVEVAATLKELKISQAFIAGLQAATPNNERP
ncbi:hypothetical protein B0H34DRAFT_675322 [Crassisporium funariophilum]|nr:hypothetical protein B0H34DRAFT_675322 [Crassisporium funariophilum]